MKANDPNAIILSSDYCQEFLEVTVKIKENETYCFDSKKRKKSASDGGGTPNAENEPNGFAKMGLIMKVIGSFR